MDNGRNGNTFAQHRGCSRLNRSSRVPFTGHGNHGHVLRDVGVTFFSPCELLVAFTGCVKWHHIFVNTYGFIGSVLIGTLPAIK